MPPRTLGGRRSGGRVPRGVNQVLTPEQIRDRGFATAADGYARAEVSAFLREVATQQADLRARLGALERRLEESATTRTDSLRALGEEVSRVLVAAEESAAEIRGRAEQQAERQRGEAADLLARAEREREALREERRVLEEVRDRLLTELRAAAKRLRRVPTDGVPRPAVPRPAVRLDATAVDLTAGDEPTPPEPLALRGRTLAAIRPAILRHLTRSLQDLQNGTLAALRESTDPGAVERLLPDDDEVTVIDTAAHRFLTAAFRGGVADAAGLVDRRAEVGAVAEDGIRPVTAQLRVSLGGELTAALRGTLQAGLDADEPAPVLSERVGRVFRDLRGDVVEELAEEALVRAYSHGLVAVWQHLDVDRVAWVLAEEQRCPERRCRTNASEAPVAPGEEFASGHAVPPAHRACGCALAPAPRA